MAMNTKRPAIHADGRAICIEFGLRCRCDWRGLFVMRGPFDVTGGVPFGQHRRVVTVFVRHHGFQGLQKSNWGQIPICSASWISTKEQLGSNPHNQQLAFPPSWISDRAVGMARATRIDWVDGWHHVTTRGNERRAIFQDAPDRPQFLELLGDWVALFGLRLHADGLMDDHYHLLVQTPLAHRSVAVQWLGVSSSVWLNRRHRWAGH